VAESVPSDLRTLVEASLAPGVLLEQAGKSSEQPAWWFKLKWRKQYFELWVREFWWQGQATDLIALRARIAAPAPEATLSGQRFWLRLKGVSENDNVRYQFTVLKTIQDKGISPVVKIPGTARQMLNNTAAPTGRYAPEYETSTAIIALKDHFGDIDPNGEIIVNGNNLDSLTKRARPDDPAIRRYVSSKLYQAYQSSTSGLALKFGKHDLDYLGVSEEDLQRVISLVEGEDWDSRELTLKPRKAFLQRFESEFAGGSSGVGGRTDTAASEASRRTVFICHAESDKTIANVLKDYLEASDQPIKVFVASHPDSLPGGRDWWNGIIDNLKMATIVLSLYSPRSKERPWLHFESGGAHLRGTLVIPLAVAPELKTMPLPLGALQAYALDAVGDVRSLVHQIGRTFGVRFTNPENALHDRLVKEMQHLSDTVPASVSSLGSGDTSWKGVLRKAVAAGHLIYVSPAVPSIYNPAAFEVVAVDDERIGLRKADSGHLANIPPYTVIGIHKEQDGRYLLRIGGRIQWIDADNSWRFMPEALGADDPDGLPREVDMQSTDVERLSEKLRTEGWQVEFEHETRAKSRLSQDRQLVYGHDGRYLRVRRDQIGLCVMVKHR